MNESATRAAKAQEQLHGTPSFLGARIGDLEDLGAGRVALSGVFCDHFSGGQPGARFAPRQLRYATHSIPVSERLCMAHSQRAVIDIGDLNVFPLQAARNAQALSLQSETIALSGAKLLAIGGDYSITPHLVEGLLRAHQGRQIGMLRLSRRLDVQSSVEFSTRASASRHIGNLLCGNILADDHGNAFSNILFVGTSPPVTAEELASVSAANMISMHALTNTTDAGLTAALRALQARCDGFYLSVDADVLSPLYGETCGPRSGAGLSPAGLAKVLDQLEQLPILGADVMGHVPDLDLAGITATAIILSVVSRITELLLETPRVA